MPIYDFKCPKCETNVEYILKIAEMDDPLNWACTHCGYRGLERVITTDYAIMTPESLGRKKAPREFRDVLSSIHRQTKGSQIRDR